MLSGAMNLEQLSIVQCRIAGVHRAFDRNYYSVLRNEIS
jgi:hypothetical protein